MQITDAQRDTMFKALGLFIEGFRPYVVALLQESDGERWPARYAEALGTQQKDHWNESLRKNTSPEALIDYNNLKGFAIRFRDLLRGDFGKDVNKLPTWLDEIAECRNALVHFSAIDQDTYDRVFLDLKSIVRTLGMAALEEELDRMKSGVPLSAPVAVTSAPQGRSLQLRPWFEVVMPHLDIREGRLDESVFAANLSDVALDRGREIYQNPVMFFSKTFFTAGLKQIAKRVVQGLNGQEDAENRVVSLQTGFGGGKTHTLISLYHLCRMGSRASQSADMRPLIDHTGLPAFEQAQIAVFTNATNDAASGRLTPESIHLQTIWGEIAYQLGGAAAYALVAQNDAQLIAPAGRMKAVLEMTQPALILIDELADYCVKASGRKVGNSSLADQTISFMQELTEAVSQVPSCVLVVTLPASPQEVGNTPEAQAILNSLQKRVSRVGADAQPVADDEIYEVIRRRLFDSILDQDAVSATASSYLAMYQELAREVPAHATRSEYRRKIEQAYPFHPELIDVFRVRWASHSDFQRTRGALRLLAAIVSDLWKRSQNLPGSNLLIDAGHANFANLDALSGQLKRLFGSGYDAVITADVAGTSSNAFKIDGDKPEYGQVLLTQRTSAAILLNSFGSEGSNKGISIPELKLNLLSPGGGVNHNSINGALDELEGKAHYLYAAQVGSSGKRFWFHTKPNINILITNAKSDVRPKDIESEVLRRLADQVKAGGAFKILVDPATDDIPEQKQPTLVVMAPQYATQPASIGADLAAMIGRIATKKGNSERIYRNTILFLVPAEAAYGTLQSDAREWLACQKIAQEYRTQLEGDQKAELGKRIEEANRKVEKSLAATYCIVLKHRAKQGLETLVVKQFRENLERQISEIIAPALKEEEWVLDGIGLNALATHNLLPTADRPIKVKDVYEAFLRFDDKPMVTGPKALQGSLERYCYNGDFCIASGDGASFTRYFYKERIEYFGVEDERFWLLHPAMLPAPEPVPLPVPPSNGGTPPMPGEGGANPLPPTPQSKEEGTKALEQLVVHGKVSLEQYYQLLQSFIAPFTTSGNRVEIEVRFTMHSSAGSPLDESKPLYKNAKEAAKQLGLNFEAM